MPNRIILKKGTTAGTAPLPADLEAGELAVNTADGALFTKLENGTIYTIAPASTSALSVARGGTGLTTAPGALQLLVGQAGGTYALRTLTAGANVSIVESGGNVTITSTAAGGGDVTGPASATDSNVVFFDGTTGKVLKDLSIPSTALVLTTGSYANPAWITSLAWSKLTGTPTTLSGYGITDAQPLDADLTAIAGLAGTTGLLRKTASNTWSLDTATYLTGNQTITLSGGATGSGTTAITVTLSNTAVTGQALTGYTVGTNTAVAAADTILQAIQKLQGQVNARLTANQTITLSGDVTGSGATAITTTLANSGVTAASYGSASSVGTFTVDAKGRLTTAASTSIAIAASQVTSGDITARIPWAATSAEPFGVYVGIGHGSDTVIASGEARTSYEAAYAAGSRDNETLWLLSDQGVTVRVGLQAGWGGGVQALAITAAGAATFSGTVNATTFVGALTGNASTATTLQTGRTIGMTGDVTWTSASFDGSANVTGTATLANSGVTAASYGSASSVATFTVDAKGRITTAASTAIGSLNTSVLTAGTLGVARGGTGVATITGLVKGNGTSAFSAAVAGTDYVVPSGSITGNAATATTLETARTLWGQSFNGSASIGGRLEMRGSVGDGLMGYSQGISWAASVVLLNNLAYVTGNISAAASYTYIGDANSAGSTTRAGSVLMTTANGNTLQWLVAPTSTGAGAVPASLTSVFSIDGSGNMGLSGTINGQTISGAANFTGTVNAAGTVTAPTFSGALSGNATTATTLATGRTIGMTGDVTWTSASFNGSANVTGTATLTNTAVTGQALTGYAVGTNTAVAATDTILQAVQKLQGQVNARAASSHTHALTDITYSGLTTGTVLRATGATAASFGALDLTLTASTTGALRVDRGGTGIASYTTGNYIYASAATTLAQRTPTQVLSDISGEFQQTLNVPRSNLSNPTVREMALFDGQFDNKTELFNTDNFWVETSTDGTTWTDAGASLTNRQRLVGGDANNSSLSIPNGTPYFRIRFRAVSYVYLSALYAYYSTQGNSTQVHIYRKHDNDAGWTAVSNSSTTVSSWPGHLFLPHTTIPFNPNATQGTHNHEVYVVFIPTWSHATNGIALYKLQWWGGYPAGRRNIYSTDEFGAVTFPDRITATGRFSSTAKNHLFGSAAGSTGDKANFNILLYDNSANNWAGLTSLSTGAVELNTGTSTRYAWTFGQDGITTLPGALTTTGTITGGTFSGSGASLTSLNASNLSSGTVPDARISGAYTGITTLTVTSAINPSTNDAVTLGGSTIGYRTLWINHTANKAEGLQLVQSAASTPSPRIMFGNTNTPNNANIIFQTAADTLSFTTGGTVGSSSGTTRWSYNTTGIFPAVTNAMALGSASFVWSNVVTTLVTSTASSTRDKLRVWDSSTYTIGMQSSFSFGGLVNDYAMTFQMSNTATRGFWWGDASHSNAQGAMAVTTDGKLTVAHSARIGYGESDATVPGATYRLDVSGAGYIDGALTTTGNVTATAGRLRAGDINATGGSVVLESNYSNGTLNVFGSMFSSAATMVGFGVTPSTAANNAFFSSTGINIGRSALLLDGGEMRWYLGTTQTVTVGSAATLTQYMTLTTSGLSVTGTVTATTFSGSGASLTSIPAGQLTGTVDLARLTTTGAGPNLMVSYGRQADATDLNGLRESGVYGLHNTVTNGPGTPGSYEVMGVFRNSDVGAQLYLPRNASTPVAVRGWSSSGSSFTSWRELVDTSLNQTIGGTKTFSNTITGSISGNAGTVTNGVYTSRTLTITNGTGITGGSAQTLAADRSWTIGLTGQALALHNLATNGIIARTGSGTVAGRTITGTTNQVTVTNGDGVSGNPTLALPQNIHTAATPTFAAVILGTDPGGSNLVRAASARITSLGVGRDASGTAGRIDATNDIVAYSSSDARLKENIQPIVGALDIVSRLNGVQYNWRQDDAVKLYHGYGPDQDLGVLADDVLAVLPQIVQIRESGFKAVRYERIIPVLIEAIKEQQREIEGLRLELQAVKES